MSAPVPRPSSTPTALHAIAWPGDLSGAPRSMEESLAALRDQGHPVEAWLATADPAERSAMPERLRSRGIRSQHREAYTAVDPLAVGALAKSLRSLSKGSAAGAVLHTHGERALRWGAAAARAAGVPHVHTHHGFSVDGEGSRKRRVALRLMRKVDALVTIDPSHAFHSANEVVVSNCLGTSAFVGESNGKEPASLRRRHGIRKGQTCFLFLGRLCSDKGADYLAVIQAELQRHSGSARLVVAGSGDLSAGVEAMTDVLFLGQRDDPSELLHMADVVLIPSRTENLPMVALEAAAVGVPAVGFAVGGLAATELVQTVPAGEVQTLVKLALELVRNPKARVGALDCSGRALGQHHNPEAHAEALARVYRELG